MLIANIELGQDKAQSIIDEITKAYEGSGGPAGKGLLRQRGRVT